MCDYAEVEIESLAHGGDGVGHIDGQVCFVAGGVPGDRLRVRVTRRKKQALWAAIEDVLEPSPDRVAPACPVFGECGGCQWLDIAYAAQAAWKQRVVRDCMARIGGVDIAPEWVPIDEDRRLHYRTRARIHCNGESTGFYARQSRRIVPIAACPLCHETLNAGLKRLGRAKLRGPVELTANPYGEQVLAWTPRPHRRLQSLFPQLDWPGKNAAPASFVCDGRPIVNGSFSQSSLVLNRALVETVRDFIGAPETLLDLYCGNGNLTCDQAETVKVTGLDHDGQAVRAAAESFPGTYRRGDEKAFAAAVLERPWDVIVLDPPRTGAKAIVDALGRARAGALVYVSCDPATLARDAAALTKAGWQVERLAVLDLFPQTFHVECIARFTPGDAREETP